MLRSSLLQTSISSLGRVMRRQKTSTQETSRHQLSRQASFLSRFKVAEWDAKVLHAVEDSSPYENLATTLAAFEKAKGYTFASLEKATEARDQWGAHIGVLRLSELKALDKDGDQIVSAKELQSFTGLQNRYCDSLGEWKYSCKSRCEKGRHEFDGDFRYFAGTATKPYYFGEEALNFRSFISSKRAGAITEAQKHAIGMGLHEVVKAGNVKGAVCELGVFTGETSVFLYNVLKELSATEKHPLHLFDSFQGLPDCDKKKDQGMCGPGSMSVPENQVKAAFTSNSHPVPPMHKGFFKDIPDDEFPDEIAFAFIDADLYPSMLSALQRVWPRLSKGGVVLMHDYAWEGYPGTEFAADDFLKDKVEKVQLPGGENGVACNIGYLRKQ